MKKIVFISLLSLIACSKKDPQLFDKVTIQFKHPKISLVQNAIVARGGSPQTFKSNAEGIIFVFESPLKEGEQVFVTSSSIGDTSKLLPEDLTVTIFNGDKVLYSKLADIKDSTFLVDTTKYHIYSPSVNLNYKF